LVLKSANYDIIFRHHSSVGGLSQFGSSEQTVLSGLKETFHKIKENSDSFPPFFLVQVRIENTKDWYLITSVWCLDNWFS
jgi:hypothetical protein